MIKYQNLQQLAVLWGSCLFQFKARSAWIS